MLSKEERLQIIESQEKTLAYSKYGIELNILRENAKSSPNKETVESLKRQISDLDAEISVLLSAKKQLSDEAE